MTRDEAVARIKEGLQFRRDLDTSIKQRMEEARVDYEQGKTLPWFLLQEDATLTLAQGSNSILLPTGFIRQARFERLRYTPIDSDSSRFIPWKSLDDAEVAYGDDDAGGPQVAVLRGTSIRIFPTADTDYTLTWSYYKHSESLDGADISDHPWLVNCPDCIIGEAGWRIAQDLKNDHAAAKFDIIRAKGRSALIGEDVERELAGGPIVMGANL